MKYRVLPCNSLWAGTCQPSEVFSEDLGASEGIEHSVISIGCWEQGPIFAES